MIKGKNNQDSSTSSSSLQDSSDYRFDFPFGQGNKEE